MLFKPFTKIFAKEETPLKDIFKEFFSELKTYIFATPSTDLMKFKKRNRFLLIVFIVTIFNISYGGNNKEEKVEQTVKTLVKEKEKKKETIKETNKEIIEETVDNQKEKEIVQSKEIEENTPKDNDLSIQEKKEYNLVLMTFNNKEYANRYIRKVNHLNAEILKKGNKFLVVIPGFENYKEAKLFKKDHIELPKDAYVIKRKIN